MVAGFGPLFKTDITHSSNTLMVVLWSDKMVVWWQVLIIFKNDPTNKVMV